MFINLKLCYHLLVLKKRVLITGILSIILAAASLFLGSIPPSPFYYLKITRETIQTFFIFGDEDKTNWFLIRADKRLDEAQKLKNKHLEFLADLQIQTAKDYQSEAEILLEDLKNKTNITYLRDRSNQNIEKLISLEAN